MDRNPKTSIKDLKNRIISQLVRNSSKSERIIQSRFYKKSDNVKLIGIKVPVVRKICIDSVNNISLSKTDLFCLSEELLKEEIQEYKTAGIILLKLNRHLLDSNDIEFIKELFLKDYLNNWALIDTISLSVIGYIISKEIRSFKKVVSWRECDNIYIKRASIVSLIKVLKSIENLDIILKHCRYFFPIRHSLVTKANGWLLREIGKLNKAALKEFLIKNLPLIPRITLQYAIEKFPQQERVEVLSISYRRKK